MKMELEDPVSISTVTTTRLLLHNAKTSSINFNHFWHEQQLHNILIFSTTWPFWTVARS